MQDTWLGPVEKDQKTFYEKQRIIGSGHRCEEEAGSLEACHILMRMNAFQQDKGSKLGSHSNTLEEWDKPWSLSWLSRRLLNFSDVSGIPWQKDQKRRDTVPGNPDIKQREVAARKWRHAPCTKRLQRKTTTLVQGEYKGAWFSGNGVSHCWIKNVRETLVIVTKVSHWVALLCYPGHTRLWANEKAYCGTF